ncbi:MAG: endoglucanase [Phenylobacterium sp.]|uniref:endoglucanase n=1 Tax=Phenylobacterium sp. TaxID=1871053 RepID=UPI003567B8F9
MRRFRRLGAWTALAAALALAAPPPTLAAPERAPAAADALNVRVGQADDFSRIEFHWRGGAGMTVRRDGRRLILRFSRDAQPDISRLRVSPPRWLEGGEQKRVRGRLELHLTLAENADVRTGTADGSPYVVLFEKAAPPPKTTAQAPDPSETPRPDPTPASGVVRMDAKVEGRQVLLRFAWANPGGAAVFRRGDAVWIVFDAPARINVSTTPKGLRQLSDAKAYRGADYSAVRIASPAETPVAVSQQGPEWTVALGPGVQDKPGVIKISRNDVAGPAGLVAAVSGVSRIVRMTDPVVGDELTIATALGPAKVLPSRREYVQFAFLPTAHGLALETYADNLLVSRRGDLVAIARPQGLVLSPGNTRKGAQAALEGAPQPLSLPGLVDHDAWARTGSGGFLARYNALLDAAAEETAKGAEAPAAARLALARFLVGSQLSYEAIGVLNDLARRDPRQLSNPEFRGLRGAAKVMARRYQEASADFASPVLADDPASALWRSYIAAQGARWAEARQAFAAGARAYDQFPAQWKARFARADAQAALALGDLTGATVRVNLALMARAGPGEDLATRLLQARLLEAQGDTARALAIYQAVQKSPLEQLASPALLRATQIRYQGGQLTPAQAAQVFDSLRFRWRGDATELETIRALGRLYLDQGRYREALEALRSAGLRLPDLPEAVALQADLAQAFRTLFLDGMADGLEPVQALALFFDFKELTPIGADGDMMVRKLTRRLVDVDLLAQAAELLDYQANNRLDGVARAQVATDLAVIHLMDRQPEKALAAINASRTTVLPTALNVERRRVEARALTMLGRHEHALEVIQRDTSREAADLRAEIMWRQKDWAGAAAAFERSLGERWKDPAVLSADEEGRLLRAGVAYSLAGDEAALARLETRWSGFYDKARNPAALRVALGGAGSSGARIAEIGRLTADTEAFAGWVAKMKERFRQGPTEYAPAPLAKPPTLAPAPQKQAAADTPDRRG